MLAVRIHETGGPEVLKLETLDTPRPGPGQVLIRHSAIGVNFIDTYHRTSATGPYGLTLPAILGVEGAGVVEELGEGVHDFAPGDRVAYGNVPGAYAELRTIAAEKLVKLLDGVQDELAAAAYVKGVTAHYLLHDTFSIGPEHTILVHAAAGGVGSILCQWARHLGARVIGTAGSPAKAALAREHGCAEVILYREEDFAQRVKSLTAGRGVDVVYDSVGQDTFAGSLNSLRPFGLLVSYGQASGVVPPVDLGVLAQKGSLFVTRPTLVTHLARREDIVRHTQAVFEALAQGIIRVEVSQRAQLRDVVEVHREMEARRTTGSVILVP